MHALTARPGWRLGGLALALLAACAATLPPAHAQSRPRPELNGMVAVAVVATTDGSPADKRACGADAGEMERRVLAVLAPTRLLAAPGVRAVADAVQVHPEYQRLSAAHRAAEATRRAAAPEARLEAQRAEEAAQRALTPWEEPPLLIVSAISLVVSRGVCAEYLGLEVTGRVEPTRIVGTGAPTTGSVTLFLRAAMISGPASNFRARRARVLEEMVGDFARTWEQSNPAR
ncbi:hypothetical protein [Neoroseomonas oryzicola]|uniref:DUF3313 domain-containing protein n=1 Tax=Neoroseomonas oryzicola TaxID=535904 RepID=A0A9X9WQG2_9PROT|nr:hypothetical protein [Neoroseomonas oryzicola]MBR0662572.1 hypothetical protein [Neoroseomonas oryzicola]NKE19226.1 hypothetical protein [Neoroseomonas oryzicola]